jgi:hypothetical protein
LVQLVVEELLNRVEIPGRDTGPWDLRLKALEANVRRELGGIPGVRTGVSVDGSPASRRLTEGVLAILHDAGFDEADALLAYGALFTYMVGQLDLDVVVERREATNDGNRFAELIDRSAGGQRPSPDELFDFGFDLMLVGLREVLDSRRHAKPS